MRLEPFYRARFTHAEGWGARLDDDDGWCVGPREVRAGPDDDPSELVIVVAEPVWEPVAG
jgi:hypothetical protein